MRVAIVGAGLCGLATARAIARSCPSAAVQVFESGPGEARTAARSFRRHGTRILLSSGSRAALQQLGIDPPPSNDPPRHLVYYDHAGSRPLYTVQAPSLDAVWLRRQLLTTEVQYGADVADPQQLLDAFDVVIGCDGRRSVLRSAAADVIAEQTERDLGLRRITLDVPLAAFAAAQHHDLAFVGQRSIAIVARYGDRLRASLVTPSDVDNDDLIAAYRRITRDWLHPVRDLVDHLDPESVVDCDAIRDRDAPQVRCGDERVKVALAGEALWSLAPYTGHAAGVALADAAAIGKVLATDGADLSKYWRHVQDAAAPFINEARGMSQFIHSDDVADRLVDLQNRQQQQYGADHE